MIERKIDGLGTHRWYNDGELHRENGPAIEYFSGSKSWWVNGKRHRDDGPAIVRPDGSKEWWINGKEYTEDEYVLLQFSKGIIK